MNVEQMIETQRAIAEQHYPEGIERAEYHIGLLESKLREVAYRFREVRGVDIPPPSLLVLPVHDFPLPEPGPVPANTSVDA